MCLWNWDLDRQPRLPWCWQSVEEVAAVMRQEEGKRGNQPTEIQHFWSWHVALWEMFGLETGGPMSGSPPTNTSVILCATITPSSFMSVPRQLAHTDGLELRNQELPTSLAIPEVWLQQATCRKLFANSSKCSRAQLGLAIGKQLWISACS